MGKVERKDSFTTPDGPKWTARSDDSLWESGVGKVGGKVQVFSTPDGPKWTARSDWSGRSENGKKGGQRVQVSTLQTALNGRPAAQEAVGGVEVKVGWGVKSLHSRRP